MTIFKSEALHDFFAMADPFETDGEKEDFLGFPEERESSKNLADNESDISVSTVNTEDLSDFDPNEWEIDDEEEVDELYNSNRDAVNVDPFVQHTGPVTDVTGTSALDFFKLLFKDENFNQIAVETNCYAQQSIAVKVDPLWYETTADEICTFFALNILSGIKQLPEIHAYWSKNPFLGIPEVQKVLSRNRFMKFSQYLHLNDKSKELPHGDTNHDKLVKVRPLLDAVVVSIKSEYLLSKCISIDEAIVPFKGRLGMKQYMPQKPTKRGIKVWECAGSTNHYVMARSVA